jgi:hypothetical protein
MKYPSLTRGWIHAKGRALDGSQRLSGNWNPGCITWEEYWTLIGPKFFEQKLGQKFKELQLHVLAA